jgi:RNA polymerase sigma factor (sigma-70 family)
MGAIDVPAVGEDVRGGASGMSLSAHQAAQPVPGDTTSLRGELEPALAELSARQRQVLSLRYFAGLDDIEISEALGLSVKAVRKYAVFGIAALRARNAIGEDNPLVG